MRVVNERRWRRTKWVFTLASYILVFYGMGGLEDAPVRSWPAVLLGLLIALPMTMHMTTDWDRESRLEEWWYRQGRE